MTHQKHVLLTGLALFLLVLGASVECRADGIGIKAPPAVSASAAQKITFRCVWHLSSCVAAVWSSQATAHHAIRQASNQDGSSRLALDTGGAKIKGQTPDKSASGGRVNFTVASMGAGKATHKGRFALNMMLDSNYRGDIFNSEAPFEAMQVSLNYARLW